MTHRCRSRLLMLLVALVSGPLVQAQDKPYRIVCTVGMITDAVRTIAGERAEVQGLLGEGVDPHLYKPTRSDMVLLMRADVVFYNGLLLEGKMTDALIRAATAGKKVWAVTELLDEEFLLEPPEFLGHFDPHVWMDPLAWKKAAEVIRDKLTEYDPDGKDVYAANAEAYMKQLDDLAAYAKKALASVPQSQRILVTAHDAFNYFGRRFDFEVVGIQGISTESEAGIEDVTPYDLRRTFTTRLMERGADLATVMQATGHTTVAILMRHYAKAVEGKQRAAVEGLFGYPDHHEARPVRA